MLEFVPCDWEERTLSELCALRRELVEPSSTGTQRYVGLEHIDPGVFRLRRWGDERNLRSTKSRFYVGDVLYGKLRPYLDKAVLAEWGGVCSTDILTIQPRSNIADASFLTLLTHTPAFIAHAVATTSGVNHPRTGWSEIARFSHPIPPIAEQRAIATVLSKIHAAVEMQDKIVIKLKELKAATMAKLFREGLRDEPLKQTEIGEIPESWEVVRLGEIAERITKGSSPNWQGFEYCDEGALFVRSQNVGFGELLLSETVYVPQEFSRKERRSVLSAGDVLINIVGASIGRAAVADERLNGANINQAVALVRLRQAGAIQPFWRIFLSPGPDLNKCTARKRRSREPILALKMLAPFLYLLRLAMSKMRLQSH